MPSSIDRRIVEMQFDNANFERNIGQSIKSLDTFKQQLDFTGYERGFQNLEKIANQVNFDNLTDSLNYLESRFSNIGIIGMTVVQNLTTSAMQSFHKLSSSIIGLAKTGGINRALNIENAKFQLEGLGVAWKDIESDISYGVQDTAYGLDEAAKAASQLVASQVQLGNEMKGALRGISGVAAMTNSSYSDIAHIFTTVAGNGKLMTMQLQQLSYKGLNAAATLAKHLHVSEAALREMVTKGEIDFKTFSEAMDDAFGAHAKDANKTFNGAMSNMRAAFSRLGAKFATPMLENIRQMVVSLIDVINDVSKALDPLINEFNHFFGNIKEGVVGLLENADFVATYRNYIEALRYAFYDFQMILLPIREAFRDIFPAKSISDAKSLSERVKEFTKTFYITRENAENLKRTFRGLFAVIDIIGQAFSAVAKAIFGAQGSIFDMGSSILEVTAGFGDYLVRVSDVIRRTNYFGTIVDRVKSKLEPFYYFFKGLFITMGRALKNFEFKKFGEFLDKLKGSEKSMTTLQIIGEGIKAVFSEIGSVFRDIFPIASALFDMVVDGLGQIGRGLGKAFTGGGWDTLLALANGSLITGIIYTIERILSTINGVTWRSLGILDTIRKPFLSVRRAIDIFAEGLKYENLLKIAKAVGILTLSLVALSLIDADRLNNSLTIVTVCILELIGAFKILNAQAGNSGKGLSGLFDNLGAAATKGSNAFALAAFFIGFSSGVLLLAGAVKKLASLPMEDLSRGLLAVTGLMGSVMIVANSMGQNEGEIKTSAASMIGFATAIGIMASSVKKLSAIPWDELKYGLGSIGGLILAVGVFVNKVDTESFKLSALSMIGFAAGVMILAQAVKSMSEISYENGEILIGILGVLTLISAVGAFVNLVDTESFKLSAISMLGFATAIAIMGDVAKSLGVLPWEQVAVGVGGILALLLGFGLFINNVKGDGLMQIAAGMVVMSAAMRLLTPALIALGSLEIDQVAIALGALFGSLMVFGYGAQMLSPAIAVIMSFAQSILMIGLGIGAATAGIALLVNVILALAASGNVLTVGIEGLIAIIAGAIPQIAIILANGMSTFIVTVLKGFSDILLALDPFIAEVCKFIIEQGPEIMDAIMALGGYVIQIIDFLLPDLADALVRGIVTILEAISDVADQIVIIGAELILKLLDGIDTMLPAIIQKAFEIVITLLNGLADALDANSGLVAEAMARLMESMVNAIAEAFPIIFDKAVEIVANIGKGLLSAAGELYKAGVELVGELLKAIGVPEEFVNAGVNTIKGFIDGVVSWAQNAVDAVAEVAQNIVDKFCEILKIHSPSEIMNWVGEMIDTGLGEGITDNEDIATAAAGAVGDKVVETMESKVDDGIDSLKNKMSKFDSYLEWWKRKNESSIYSVAQKKALSTESARSEKFQQKQKERTDAQTKAEEELAGALDEETSAAKKNSKATGGSTKAKKENKVANDKKTKAINDESKALDNETESVEDNEQAIRDQAEQIEVVTEKFNEALNYVGLRDPFKMAGKTVSAMAQLWTRTSDEATKSISNINNVYNELLKTIPSSTDKISKGLYKFSNDTGKYLRKVKVTSTIQKTAKKITKTVEKTGKIVAKVGQDTAKIFYKEGGSVNKMTIALSKNIKNLGKRFLEAKKFAKEFGDGFDRALKTETSEEFVNTFRQIEKSFGGVANKKLPKQIQTYMKTVHEQFQEFDSSMSILSKRIGGSYNVLAKNSKVVPYVEDAFISLAATLYDGSEAANEYATEMARLEFLFENGLATEEEIAEKRRWYIDRIREALQEYKETLDSTYNSQLDVWSMFDKHSLADGTDLISNVESQIAGFKTFADMAQVLSERLPKVATSSALIREIMEGGVENYGKLEGLLKLSDAELNLFIYDYQLAWDTAQNTADSALATIADSTTWAAKRAIAASKDAAEKTLKFSKNVRAEQENSIKAVARAIAENNKITKKQEKKFLANLSNEQKALYKKEKKYQKLLKKRADAQRAIHDEEVKAKQAEEAAQEAAEKAKEAEEKAKEEAEAARQAEEDRVNAILETIKTYDDYYNALRQYNSDTNVLTKVTESLASALKPVAKYVNDISTGSIEVKRLVAFTQSLSSVGEDVEDVFTDINTKLNNYISNIRDATKASNEFFNAFSEGTSKSLSEMMTNYLSNVEANAKFANYIKEMANMGYSSNVIEAIGEEFKSNRSDTLAKMEILLKATNDEVKAYSHLIVKANEESEKAVEAGVQSAMNAANVKTKAQVEAAKDALNIAQNKVNEMLADYNNKKAANDADKNAVNSVQNMVNEATNVLAQKQKALEETRNKIEQAERDLRTISNLPSFMYEDLSHTFIPDEVKNLMERYGATTLSQVQSKVYEILRSNSAGKLQDIENEVRIATDILNLHKRELEQVSSVQEESARQFSEASANYANATNELANATNALTAAENAYADQDAINRKIAEEVYERERLIKTTLEQIKSEEDLSDVLYRQGTKDFVLIKVQEKLKKSVEGVSDAIAVYRKRFAKSEEDFFNGPDKMHLYADNITGINRLFLKMAESLKAASDESDDYFGNMTNRLNDYKSSLYDTIKGQVSLFDTFKKYSGEKATTASTYLENMESQLSGLEEWTDGLETLAKRGVSADIIKMFAEEGQNSFEKVMAFVNATDSQLGELISQYERYQKLTEEATNRTLATIAHSYSDAAEEALNSLKKAFQDAGTERFEEAAYESSQMIITGIKNGLTNAMPEIVGEVANTTVNTVAAKAGEQVGQALSKGLTTSVANSVETTVNAAIEKFKMAVDAVNDYIKENMESDFTITIHVNTSEIDAAVARMNAAIGSTSAYAGETGRAVTVYRESSSAPTVYDAALPSQDVTLNYTQNNYSPVALSRTEIYRQTRNQLSTIEGVVANAGG